MSFQDHFSTQAVIYAQARPTYPAALFTELAPLWGAGVRKISWPLSGRLGRVG